MKDKIKVKYLLILIVLLGFVLRIAFLNVSPPGFNEDETSFGYNAYSILKTGRDEWGQSFPILFKAFGEYKEPGYIYLSIPFIAVLGLSELSVRLPAILAGTISILLIYILAKEIFKSDKTALLCAFILAISPWAIQFSRAVWESNVAVMFILFGVIAFLKGLEKEKWLIISLASFALAVYTYRAALTVVPLLLVFLIFFYRKLIPVKRILLYCGIGMLIVLPLLIAMMKSGNTRFNGISIFSDKGVILRQNELRNEDNKLLGRLFYNTYTAYSLSFATHYLDHFSPNFLFTKGDPVLRNNSIGTGELYLFELATILIGLFILLKSNLRERWLILAWLVIAPTASGLTFQTPNAIRSLNMVIPLSLVSGFGLSEILGYLPKLKNALKPVALLALVMVIVFSFVSFLDSYFIHLPKESTLEWVYGFPQLTDYLNQNGNKYQKIVVTLRYSQPYMMILFFSKFDPATYQSMPKTMGKSEFGFINVAGFGKYQFKKIEDSDFKQPNTLIVGTPEEMSGKLNVIKEIDFKNGQAAFQIAETK